MGKSCISPLLTVGRAVKDLEYLKFQASIFRNLCSDEGIITSNKHDKRLNKTYIGYKFRTRALPVLLPYRDLWYPQGKKIVPSNLELTSTTMAHWFCDDGCIRQKKDDRTGKGYQSLILKLSTNSFTKSSVELLHSLLTKRYGDFFRIHKDSLLWYKKRNPNYVEGDNNYFILTYTEGAWSIFHDIEAVFPLGMDRKLNVWKSVSEPAVFSKATTEISNHRTSQLMSFISCHSSFTVIDIAEDLDWFMDTTKDGKVPSSAIRNHLTRLVKDNVIVRSDVRSDGGYIYKVV